MPWWVWRVPVGTEAKDWWCPGLVVPGNITLLELPPYSPQFNSVERIWRYLRNHWVANSVFARLADIIMGSAEVA